MFGECSISLCRILFDGLQGDQYPVLDLPLTIIHSCLAESSFTCFPWPTHGSFLASRSHLILVFAIINLFLSQLICGLCLLSRGRPTIQY
jgi:hypothetical protein